MSNLISEDLAHFDDKIVKLFSLIPFLIIWIGAILLLIIKIGIHGMLGLLIILLLIPVTALMTKFSNSLKEASSLSKNKRIALTTQFIDEIKSVKMNGW